MSDDVQSLVRSLDDPEPSVRLQAATALARLGPGASPAAVGLVLTTADPSEEIAQWATSALEALGTPSPADADRLAALLAHQSPDVGYWAATLLGRLETDAAPVAGLLAEALGPQFAASVRQRAAWALGKIGPSAAIAASALSVAAASENRRLTRLAQRALDQIAGR